MYQILVNLTAIKQYQYYCVPEIGYQSQKGSVFSPDKGGGGGGWGWG